MFVDPLAEETMTPYQYVNNNPVNMIDPTGMKGEDWIFHFMNGSLLWFEDTGKGNNIYFNIDGVKMSLSPEKSGFYTAVVNYIGKSLNPDVNYKYSNVMTNTGGKFNYETNTVTVTNNAFKFHNYFDVVSVIEHELIHKKNGSSRGFIDHANVYFEQASSKTFNKTSEKFKASHSTQYAQRLLNAYVEGEIDSFDFDSNIKKYNKLNPKYQISRNNAQKPKDDILKVDNTSEIINYKKMNYSE